MAKKQAKSAAAAIDANESRAAVALTVAWMLTTLSCAAAQGVALVMWGLAWLADRASGIPNPKPNALHTVSGVLLMVGLLTGLVAIGLMAIVLRVRRARPPRAITIASVLIGLLPIATILISFFL